ncbi:unnamed protein product [Phaeothamnion confervicola]
MMRRPDVNKGLGFSPAEREENGLTGLLPPAYMNLDAQVMLAMEQMRRKSSDIEKYIFLQSLQASRRRYLTERRIRWEKLL